jgi:hypothetical protein
MLYKDFIKKLYELKVSDKNKSLNDLIKEYIDDIIYMLSKHVENKYVNDNGDVIIKEIKFDKGLVSMRLVDGIKAQDVVNDKKFIEFLNQLVAEATNSTLMVDSLYYPSNKIIIIKFKKFGK